MGNGLYGRQTERGNLAYGGGNQEWVDVENETPERPEHAADPQHRQAADGAVPGRCGTWECSGAGPAWWSSPRMSSQS